MIKTAKFQKQRTAHVVSHTHWDREWRYPFWETQLMLLEFIDELIVVLEKNIYPGFLMDGQVSPILDYLELRPQNKERIMALIKSAKIQIGPWLTLPDEYPVDAESLVRNLLLGNRKSRELGGVFNVGYTPFGWGQTAQLPQIYAGFGMDVAMIGKRVSHERAPECEFIWRGPDGSELLSTRFGEMGRQNFYFHIHLSALFGVNHFGHGWNYDWENGGIAFHRADSDQYEQDHFRLDSPEHWHPGYLSPEVLDRAWKTMDESVLANDRLMMNGCDYTASQPMFHEMIKRLNEIDKDSDRQWIHTTMPEYVKLMRRKIDRSILPVVTGELRDGPAHPLTANAMTTRLYLKRLNKQAQNMLIRFAEPFSTIATMLGAEYPSFLLDKAWDFLLKSHPHDSINGVTQDKTVLDVENRLHQVIDISQSLGNRAMQELVKNIDMDSFDDRDVLVTVFNPLPYPRREVVEAWINIPAVLSHKIKWDKEYDHLQILDTEGNPVATQWEGVTEEAYNVAEIHTRAFPFSCHRHRIFFDSGVVPACGYKIFRVSTVDDHTFTPGAPWSDRVVTTGSILVSPTVMENEFLRVEMNTNGTFNLTDKKLKKTFHNLNYYVDRGEHGNYWVNKRPMFDEVHSSLGCNARIWAEESGPVLATLVSEITMQIPKRGLLEQQRRGFDYDGLTIKTSVSLRAGEQQVQVSVEFENRHEDHYLRVMFPTAIKGATHADSGGHFIVDHRPIHPQGPTPDSIWPDMATLPQNNFVDVNDGNYGIAFINDSLTEYEVLDNDERTVALSLLRAVRVWICTERAGSVYPSQKGSQCLGLHAIRYAIRPHAGSWQDANIPLIAEQFNTPVRLVQTRKHKGFLPGQQASLFEIDNPSLRFSALKKTEDRNTFIVRIYNPTDKTQIGGIKFAMTMASAWVTNLNEKRQRELPIAKKNIIRLTVAPQKIMTIEIKTQ